MRFRKFGVSQFSTIQPETTSVADLLEISAPSMDTLENDGGEEEEVEEGEEDQEEDDDRKREMKGIRRTVLRVCFVCRLFLVDFLHFTVFLLVSLLGSGPGGDDDLMYHNIHH